VNYNLPTGPLSKFFCSLLVCQIKSLHLPILSSIRFYFLYSPIASSIPGIHFSNSVVSVTPPSLHSPSRPSSSTLFHPFRLTPGFLIPSVYHSPSHSHTPCSHLSYKVSILSVPSTHCVVTCHSLYFEFFSGISGDPPFPSHASNMSSLCPLGTIILSGFPFYLSRPSNNLCTSNFLPQNSYPNTPHFFFLNSWSYLHTLSSLGCPVSFFVPSYTNVDIASKVIDNYLILKKRPHSKAHPH